MGRRRKLIFHSGILLFFLVCLLGASGIGHAQIAQPVRFEKKFKFSDETFTIISLEDEGLALVRDKEKHEGGKKLWEVILLDSSLIERRTLDLAVDARNQLIGYEHSPGKLFLLYRQGDTTKGTLDLFEIDLATGEKRTHSIDPELALMITHFSKVGSSIVLGGYVNKEPAILLYNLGDDNMKVLPGLFQKDTELVDLRVNQNNTFNVVFIDRGPRDNRKIEFQTYDETGNLLLEDEVVMNKDKNISLQTGITSTLKREDLMLLGTWGEGNSKQSNGFYALSVDPFKDQKISYVAFGELEHYLDYQKPKRAKRIQEKSREELNAGGIPNYVNYVMPYRLQEYKQGFVLLAEVYTPSSNLNSFSNPYNPYYYGYGYSPYGWYFPGYNRLYTRPYSYGYNSRNVDEIKTYETVLVAFGPSGNVLWDASIDLDEVKQPSLEQVADFHQFDTQVALLYKKESELNVKWIDLESKEEENATEKIKLSESNDELRDEKEYGGGVKYWYGNAFYVWGFQTIKNTSQEERVRDVFYINKIVVR